MRGIRVWKSGMGIRRKKAQLVGADQTIQYAFGQGVLQTEAKAKACRL